MALVARRRFLIRSGGTIEMSWHLRHWTFGVARYEAEQLQWFRTFSLSPRPRRSLSRSSAQIVARRIPHGPEAWRLVPDAVVIEGSSADGPFELAVPAPALLGVLSWLEAGRRDAQPRLADGRQVTSPTSALATRARMNNKSDSRLR